MAKNTSFPPIKDGVKADNSTYSSNQIDRMISDVEESTEEMVSDVEENLEEAVNSAFSDLAEIITDLLDRSPEFIEMPTSYYNAWSKAVLSMANESLITTFFTATQDCKLYVNPDAKLQTNISNNDMSFYLYKNNTKIATYANVAKSTWVPVSEDFDLSIDLNAGDTFSLYGKIDNVGEHTGNASISSNLICVAIPRVEDNSSNT